MKSHAGKDGNERQELRSAEQAGDPAAPDHRPGHAPDSETSQAERAAMHPERHDLEWHYYFGAWSH